MLQSRTDWWIGKGLGRFPANHFLIGDPSEHPGDYRLTHEGDRRYLRLTGGLVPNTSWGEMFRISQRVGPQSGPVKVNAKVRVLVDTELHFEICEKHLLYNLNCVIGTQVLKPNGGQWQQIEVPLKGESPARGDWYAPRLIMFSAAVANQGGVADFAQISLVGAQGQEQIVNGNFAKDMSHWFFSSDKFHLPWHAKNMFLHVLFDQGIAGLAIWSLLVLGALASLAWGSAKGHPLAPAIAGSLGSFLVVGLFDSLLDIPRLAVLFYLLVLMGLTARSRPGVS